MTEGVVTIYPHIHKTGGKTLHNALEANWKHGYDFYKLTPSYRHLIPPEQKQLELAYKTSIQLVTGHGVTEGLINYFNGRKIRLVTTLRHPFSRTLSHFNNAHQFSKLSSKEELQRYFVQQNNFMCKWLIRKFPSFVTNVFAPIHIQAQQILSYFDTVYTFEAPNDNLSSILSFFRLEYDPKYLTHVGGKDYPKQAHLQELDIGQSFDLIKSDLLLYRHLTSDVSTETVKNQPIPRSYHPWYSGVLFNCLERNLAIDRNTLEGLLPLQEIVDYYNSNGQINYQYILDCFIDSYNNHRDSLYHTANCLDVIQKLFKKTFHWKQRPLAPSNPLSVIYSQFLKNRTAVHTLPLDLWSELNGDNDVVLRGRISFMKNQKNNYDKLRDAHLELISINPSNPSFFKMYGKYCKQNGDLKTTLLCAEKVLELQPYDPWASKVIAALLKK